MVRIVDFFSQCRSDATRHFGLPSNWSWQASYILVACLDHRSTYHCHISRVNATIDTKIRRVRSSHWISIAFNDRRRGKIAFKSVRD